MILYVHVTWAEIHVTSIGLICPLKDYICLNMRLACMWRYPTEEVVIGDLVGEGAYL